MDEKECEIFAEMVKAQQRIAAAIEKQQPSRLFQVLSMAATITAILGIIAVIDIIRSWISGG